MESDERGKGAENAVRQALIIMEKEKIVAGFYQNKQHGEIDGLGIDFLVYLKGGLILPLQVKVSCKDNENRRQKHMKKHPNIPFMIFVDMELLKKCPEKALDCIVEGIKSFLKR
ncbi:MAG: hypothetical protein Q7S81_03395 [bacterium]|nr:hypothetical protein [bacterium]